jgi:phosphate transport system permease protein
MAVVQVTPSRDVGPKNEISAGRRALDKAFWAVCGLAMACVLAPVLWIVIGVVGKAAPVWHWTVLTETTSGVSGGLLEDIAGTFAIMLGVAIVAGGIGIFGGIYLS